MSRVRGPRLIALLTAFALTTVAGGAHADTRVVDDPNDSGESDIDLASHGHTPEGRLRHRIVMYERIGAEDWEAPCVGMVVGSTRYGVCGDGRVYDVTTPAAPVPTGRATVLRPNGRTIVYEIRRSSLGNPDAYKWYAWATGSRGDIAPDSGKILHDI